MAHDQHHDFMLYQQNDHQFYDWKVLFSTLDIMININITNICTLMIIIKKYHQYDDWQVLFSTLAAFLVIVSSLLLWTKVIRDRIE